MIESVKSAVLRYPKLSWQENKGKRHKVENSGWKGSLWISTRYDGYRLQTTSEVASLLDKELTRLQGKPVGEEKGYNFWYIDDYHIVEEIIGIFGRT